MPFVVHSPFDGEPVKVRDQDIGRAIRDKQNRIFYALPKSTGDGYYSSPTRQGGLKDEQRYQRMLEKSVKTHQNVLEEVVAHDATGRKRRRSRGRLVLLVVVVVAAAAGYYVWKNYSEEIKRVIPTGDQPTSQAPCPALSGGRVA